MSDRDLLRAAGVCALLAAGCGAVLWVFIKMMGG